MKILFRTLLVGAIILMAYLCYESIMGPIRFEEEKTAREKAVISRLIDIRKAQVEFRNANGRYTGSFDTLISFIKNGKIAIVLKEGVLSDEQLEQGMTEAEAVKKGLIKREKSFVAVLDTLYPKGFVADSIRFVPGTRVEFEMAKGEKETASGLKVQVFEAKVPMDVYLNGLDKQEIINLKDQASKLNRYAGLKVGSIDEPNNNAGNWE